jgi:Tyrosine-protein kinase ephrin type A/B receptor-like
VCNSGYWKVPSQSTDDRDGLVCAVIPLHMHVNSVGAIVCDDGYIMSSTGCVLKPTSCPLGYTLPAGLSACESCPVDTYKDNTGIGACTPCQNGLYHSPVGSTSASACQISTTCGPGQYLNVDIINQSAGCTSCPVDTYKTGTNSSTTCTPCPTGQTTYGQIGQTSCQNKSTWFQGTSCTSNYGFDVNNYTSKSAYCNDYSGEGRGNSDPCCNPAAQQTTVPQSNSSPPASSCNCDSETGWDESACGGTWVAVCHPDRDGGGH